MVLVWPRGALFQQLLVPLVRDAFGCALLGRLVIGVGLCDIPLPHWNAFVLMAGRLDGWSRGSDGSFSAFPFLFSFAVWLCRCIRLSSRVPIPLACR